MKKAVSVLVILSILALILVLMTTTVAVAAEISVMYQPAVPVSDATIAGLVKNTLADMLSVVRQTAS